MKPKLLVQVSGGIAEVVTMDNAIDWEIIDFDNINAGDEPPEFSRAWAPLLDHLTEGKDFTFKEAPTPQEMPRPDAAKPLLMAAPELVTLIVNALDLAPRMNDDDPIAPALAEWCTQARAILERIKP